MAHIRKIEGFENLNEAEQALIEACKAGDGCILGDGKLPKPGDKSREIRAELLRFLILGGCEECAISEGVRLTGAVITGQLDLSFQTAKGQIVLGNCRFAEAFEALQLYCPLLNLGGSLLPGLNAQGMEAKGPVFLRSGFHASGEVSLSGALIGGQLDCSRGRFENPGGHALNAENIDVKDSVFLRDSFFASGEVRLSGAQIGGQLTCIKGKFENPDGFALNAQNIDINESVFLRDGFHASGEVRLSDAQIGGQLSCIKGKFENPDGDALNAANINVKGAVFLRDGFHATGEVSLTGALIGGQLACRKGKFENPDGDALNAQKMRVIGSFFWRNVTIPTGKVTLASAHVGDLVDDLPSWPERERLNLDGFTYDRITAASTNATERLQWLARGTIWQGEFFPQPYVQLAKVLREMGHERDERNVLLELNRLSRQHDRKRAVLEPDGEKKTGFHWAVSSIANLLRWLWDIAQRASIGYGLKPWRSLYVLAVLFTITATVAHYSWQEGSFAPNSGPILASKAWQDVATSPVIANPAERWSAKGGPGQDWESFNAFAYAADVVIPIIEFGQTPAWAPSTERGPVGWHLWWLRWVMSTLGWIVTALAAAAVTGIIKRD
jgi:hypothetical protein